MLQEERIDRFGNKVGSKAVKHEVVHTPLKTQNGQTPKKVPWDRSIMNTLVRNAIGFVILQMMPTTLQVILFDSYLFKG